MNMMEKKLLITKDYIEVPVITESELMTLEIIQEDGNSQRKICEFQVPVGISSEAFKPDYFARFSVKEYKGKTLLLKGSASEAFFERIRQVDCEFEQSDLDFSKEKQPRPKYHFTVAKGWINDPNGLVYRDGVYHLYFQYNPFDTRWENMSWGHATSRDLIHWTQHETVMYPDENGYMFSGSGFVNKNSCLGLPDDALMFYYTAAGECRPWTTERLSTQRLAYSLDDGRTLIKTDKGTVPTISHENRDPKVFWHEKTNSYIMIMWVDGNEFAILRSDDLEKWEISQRFELKDGFECPDLICLTDETDTDSSENEKSEHWFVTTADGYYYPGEFDGYSFKWNGKRHCLYMNNVPYAAQTYSNTDGRTIFVPWIRVDFPGRKYTGAMGIPRKLGLVKSDTVSQDDAYRITMAPVHEFLDYMAENNEVYMVCNCTDTNDNIFNINGTNIIYKKKTGKFVVSNKEYQIKAGLDEMTIFVDNGIVEVLADCDTMLGVYEI